jgi:hypothetical protein
MAEATQVRYPRRAMLRTAVAAVVAALPLIPEAAAGLHLGTGGTIGQIVFVAGSITGVLALPGVEAWLHQYAPWLAAQPVQVFTDKTLMRP